MLSEEGTGVLSIKRTGGVFPLSAKISVLFMLSSMPYRLASA